MSTLLDDYANDLDPALIVSFRDHVNSSDHFVCKYFRAKEGKNLWNAICSAMDWISVSVRYINNYPEMSDEIDVKAMQIYSLISSIDILNESIQLLHRVIFDDSKAKLWPFKDVQSIFKNKVSDFQNFDDDKYFKQIRAVFGAHPTDLRGGNQLRMFASWPFEHSLKGEDFAVSIYSSAPDQDDIHFGIYIEEILAYASERYQYLLQLSEKITNILNDYCSLFADQMIPDSSDIHDEIEILTEESEKRFDSDYYHGLLWSLKKLFSAKITESHLLDEEKSFKNALLPMLQAIRSNLQRMEIVDLDCDDLLPTRLPDRSLSYELGKFFSMVSSERYDPLFEMYINNFNKYSKNRYNFNKLESLDITYLKVKMMIYSKNKRQTNL